MPFVLATNDTSARGVYEWAVCVWSKKGFIHTSWRHVMMPYLWLCIVCMCCAFSPNQREKFNFKWWSNVSETIEKREWIAGHDSWTNSVFVRWLLRRLAIDLLTWVVVFSSYSTKVKLNVQCTVATKVSISSDSWGSEKCIVEMMSVSLCTAPCTVKHTVRSWASLLDPSGSQVSGRYGRAKSRRGISLHLLLLRLRPHTHVLYYTNVCRKRKMNAWSMLGGFPLSK